MGTTVIGDVTVRLTLDGSSYDAASKKSAETATASGRMRERAAKQAAAAEAFAAKYAADVVSEQSLRIVAATRELSVASADRRKAQALDKAGYQGEEAASRTLAAALQREAAARLELAQASKVEVAAKGHGITDRMAASSVVRGLNDGNVGIRTVENFLTTIPGASKALQGLFSVLGPAAFAAMVFDIGEKIYAMEQKTAKAKDVVGQAFSDLNQKAQINIDTLNVENDKLQDQIDKLSGHPNNGLATALDEGRMKADALLVSLQADRKELEGLFKETNVSNMAGFFGGVASTTRQQAEIIADEKKLEDAAGNARDNYEIAISKTTDVKAIAAAGEERNKAIKTAIQTQIDTYKIESARLKKEASDSVSAALGAGEAAGSSPIIDNGAKINNVEGRASQLRKRLALINAEQVNESRTAQLGSVKQGREGAADANRADELRLKYMEAELASEKLMHSMSLKETFDYWELQKSTFVVGSSAYNQVVEKQAAIAVESAQKTAEVIKKFKGDQKRQGIEDAGVSGLIGRGAEDMRKGAVKDAGVSSQDYIDSNQLAITNAQNAAREKEASLNDAAGRSMTRYAAAIELAKVHADEFTVQMEALEGIRDTRARAAGLDPSKENNRALAMSQAAIANAKSQRVVQQQGDNDAIYGRQSSALVGATDALDDFVRSTRDNASQMHEIISQTISGFNSQVIKSLTTRSTGLETRRAFGNYGAGLARSVAGAGLNKLEGSALGFLGLGNGKKPSGTAGDPLHVVLAKTEAAGGAIQSGIQKLFSRSSSSSKSLPWFGGGSLSPEIQGYKDSVGGSVPASSSGYSMDGMGADLGFLSAGMTSPVVTSGKNGQSTIGNAIQSFGSKGLSMALPFLASGGAVSAGTMAVVGEHGPELFVAGNSGTVVPNQKISSMGGSGSGDTHVHVDARGSTDPAQTAAAAHKAVMAAAPHIVAASLKAHRDQQRRGPTNRH